MVGIDPKALTNVRDLFEGGPGAKLHEFQRFQGCFVDICCCCCSVAPMSKRGGGGLCCWCCYCWCCNILRVKIKQRWWSRGNPGVSLAPSSRLAGMRGYLTKTMRDQDGNPVPPLTPEYERYCCTLLFSFLFFVRSGPIRSGPIAFPSSFCSRR